MMKLVTKHTELFIMIITIMASVFCSLLVSAQISNRDAVVALHEDYTVWKIFSNNLIALITIVSGIITLGLSSAVIMFLNLMNIGVYFLYTLETTSLWQALYLTVFHGLLELMGLFLGYYVVLFLSKSYIVNRTINIGAAYYFKAIKLLMIAMLLLFIAALIEIAIIH